MTAVLELLLPPLDPALLPMSASAPAVLGVAVRGMPDTATMEADVVGLAAPVLARLRAGVVTGAFAAVAVNTAAVATLCPGSSGPPSEAPFSLPVVVGTAEGARKSVAFVDLITAVDDLVGTVWSARVAVIVVLAAVLLEVVEVVGIVLVVMVVTVAVVVRVLVLVVTVVVVVMVLVLVVTVVAVEPAVVVVAVVLVVRVVVVVAVVDVAVVVVVVVDVVVVTVVEVIFVPVTKCMKQEIKVISDE